ncbi:MAG: hypothetical protein ACFB0B_11935 [Thermonemataceae bacterium]
MQLPVIKKLVETQSIEALKQAEETLLQEEQPAIDIEGEDEGEQLTHVIAAIWILEKMQTDEVAYNEACRAYTKKVRTSIS